MTADQAAGHARPASQTLHRGLLVLETMAEHVEPLTVAGLAETLGLHRSIVYRILRTLADHRLVRRHPDGRYGCAVGLVGLARSAFGDLESGSTGELSALAEDVGATAFLAVPDESELVTLVSVEPRHTVAHVRYRPGSRHPAGSGGPGIALLAAAAPREDESDEVLLARRHGWAVGPIDTQPGVTTVASAVVVGSEPMAAVGVVLAEPPREPSGSTVDRAEDAGQVGERVREAARAVSSALG